MNKIRMLILKAVILLIMFSLSSCQSVSMNRAIHRLSTRNNIHKCYCVGCGRKYEKVKIARLLNDAYIRTASWLPSGQPSTENLCIILGGIIKSQHWKTINLRRTYQRIEGRSRLAEKMTLQNKSSSSSSASRTTLLEFSYKCTENMENMNIIAASTTSENVDLRHFESHMLDTRKPETDALQKFHYSVFRLLQEIHNFSYTMVLLQESQEGPPVPPGNSIAISQMIKKGDVDISIAGGLISGSLLDDVDYLVPSSHRIRACFIYKQPREYSLLSKEFLRPFSMNIWYATALSTVAVVVVLRITLWGQQEESLVGLGFAVMSVMIQQGYSIDPKSFSSRTVLITLLLMATLLFNAYTSILVAFYMDSQANVLGTVEDLTRSTLNAATDDQTYARDWFLTPIKSKDIKNLYKAKLEGFGGKYLRTLAPEEGIKAVQEKNFAFHVGTAVGYPLIRRLFKQETTCDLGEVPMIPPMATGLLLKKNSKFYQPLQTSLRKLASAGMVNRLQRIWEGREKPECTLESSMVFPIGLDQVFGAFLCLISGAIMALTVLVFERLYDRQGKIFSGSLFGYGLR